MTAGKSFTCPACGAELEVGEQLEEIGPAASKQAEPSAAEPTRAEPTAVLKQAAEPVSFQCPACGADYETSDVLTEATH